MTLTSQKFGIADIKKALLEYKEMLAQREARLFDIQKAGVPMLVIKLEESIYRGLPSAARNDWPKKFASAMRPVIDEVEFWRRFAGWLLEDSKNGVLRYAQTEEEQQSIRLVAELYTESQVPMPRWNAAALACGQAAGKSQRSIGGNAVSVAKWAATAAASYQSAREMAVWASAAVSARSPKSSSNTTGRWSEVWASMSPTHAVQAAAQAEHAARMAATVTEDLAERATAFKQQAEKLLDLMNDLSSTANDELTRLCFAYLETRQQVELKARKLESLGVPLLLLKVEDKILQSLPTAMSRDWSDRFVSVVRPAAELNMVWPSFAAWLLCDSSEGAIKKSRTDQERLAMQRVAELYRDGCKDAAKWEAARNAAAAACSGGASQPAEMDASYFAPNQPGLLAMLAAGVGERHASAADRKSESEQTASKAAELRDAAIKDLSSLQRDEALRKEEQAAMIAASAVAYATKLAGDDSAAARQACVRFSKKLLELLRCA